jgi:hypothetical protein
MRIEKRVSGHREGLVRAARLSAEIYLPFFHYLELRTAANGR